MEGYSIDESTTRVRWVLAGTFSPKGEKRCIEINRNTFGDKLAGAGLALDVAVPDRFGAEASRTFSVKFEKLKDFKLKAVVQMVPELTQMADLAAKMGKAGAPEPDAVMQAVVDAFGSGRLAADLMELFAGDEAEAAADKGKKKTKKKATKKASKKKGKAADESDNPLDAIFAQTAVRSIDDDAKSSVDTFVKSLRGGKKALKVPSKAMRAARNLVEDTVFATARDLLISDEVHLYESAWRGLKMVLDQTPQQGDVQVLMLDGSTDEYPEGLDGILPDDAHDHPDAFFFLDPIDDPERMQEIADYCESMTIAGVVACSQELFGDGPPFAEAANKTDDLKDALPESWGELRESEASRWLTVVCNRVILAAEGVGATKRVVLGSPAFAVAAMLTKSYATIGAFGHIIGNPGGVDSPAVWTIAGEQDDTMLPLESFVSIRAQTELAGMGIAAFGSAKNSDHVVLSHSPTVRDSSDVVPLAAQIHTGKIIRFALWVADQVTPGMGPEELQKTFEDAAKVFLFGHLHEELAELTAQLWPEDGNPQIRVSAQMAPQLVGIHLVIVFNLPIR